MARYIISVDREKIHSVEETLREYFTNILIDVIDAPTKVKALEQAKAKYPNHPERQYFQAIAFNRNSITLQEIAKKKYGSMENKEVHYATESNERWDKS